jgi:hypothetical protein
MAYFRPYSQRSIASKSARSHGSNSARKQASRRLSSPLSRQKGKGNFPIARVMLGVAFVQLSVLVYVYARVDYSFDFLKGPRVKHEPIQQREPDDLLHVLPPLRKPPARFRPERERAEAMQQAFQVLGKNEKLRSCQWPKDCQEQLSSRGIFFKPKQVLAYNTLAQDRYLCGKRISGQGGTLTLDDPAELCNEPSRLFPNKPTLTGNGMPPIKVLFNADTMFNPDENDDGPPEFPNCNIPCHKGGDFDILSLVTIDETNWEVTLSMEGPDYFEETRINPHSYQNDRYYATTSFQSEIPVPYFSWEEYQIQYPAVSFEKAIKGASFLANNCQSMSNREKLVEELFKTKLRVDSLSSCHHNADPPPGVDTENKTQVMQSYLFHLAFENQREDDYITEKLWGSLNSGTLPVYLGAPNIKEHVPPNSVIFVDDFETPAALADYLIKLARNKQLYESYHAWRKKPLDQAFVQKYQFTKIHSTCRLCRWAYAKKYGFGWNHHLQEIEDVRIPRKTCRKKTGLLGLPFKEYWLSASTGKEVDVESKESIKTCKLEDSNRVLLIDGGAFSRTIYDHDGVTDLIIHGNGNHILRLVTPIQTTALRVFDGRKSWLQDGQSRIMILTSEELQLSKSLAEPGIVELPISSDLRVRVIVENVDTFHAGAERRVNYFGKLLSEDFFHSLETFLVLE